VTADLAVLLQVALVFAKLGLLSFGGGTTVLAEMQREVVGRGWVTHDQFLESYALGQLTPGPGMTLVIPIGYQAGGIWGGLVAFIAFFAPPALVALAAVSLWGRVRDTRFPRILREALLPVAAGLTLASVYTVGLSTSHQAAALGITLGATIVFMCTEIPPPVVLLAAGLVGILLRLY